MEGSSFFVLAIYKTTKKFPQDERFGLTSQLRRAASSIATNIVEGYAKQSKKELLRFLEISKGSLVECAYHLELSRDLGYLSESEYLALEQHRGRVGFLLARFRTSIVAKWFPS